MGCAQCSLYQSLARAKISGFSPLRAKIQSPKKFALQWVNTHVNNFFVCGPKFENFSQPNVGGVVVDQLLCGFSTCGTVPEIFAIKVESCQKSREILDGFFALSNFRGQAFQKLYPGSRHVVWIKICDDIPISSEHIDHIDVYTLNFEPNFKFLRLKFLGGGDPRLSWGVC